MDDESAHFQGVIGQTVRPATFPARNYVIEDGRHDYEANWAFCHFDDGDVYAARFGFGRGRFDARDYGAEHATSASFLFLHAEVMTAAGAILWRSSQRFTSTQVTLAHDRLEARLSTDQKEIFRISGWPSMDWRFASDDGEIRISAHADLSHVTILPDCRMQHNLFAMWLAIGRLEGEVRFQGYCWPIAGTIFYDHPRVTVQASDAPPFGWYIYTPMRFGDGSHLAGYYMCDATGQRVDGYAFGWYVDADGRGHWLEQTLLERLTLGAGGQPIAWRQHWRGSQVTLVTEAKVRDTRVRKAWGDPGVALLREDSLNLPLVFDAHAAVVRGRKRRELVGGGVAEFLAHPAVLRDMLRGE